jgi:hypothetical protein
VRDPGVTGGNHRNGDLGGVAGDVAGVVEEIGDRHNIENFERCAIGIEERSHGGTLTARQRSASDAS